MKESKNIDRLFQEKFRDFESYPPERVWNQIEKKLEAKPSKSMVPFWMWFSGIAVGLSLLFVMNNPFVNPVHLFTSQPENSTKGITTNTSEISEKTPETTSTTTFDLQKFFSQIIYTDTFSNRKTYNSFKISNPLRNFNMDFLKKQSENKESLASSDILPVFIVPENQKEDLEKQKNFLNQKKDFKRWSITTVAAPIFLNSFNNNVSGIDPEMNHLSKQSKVSMSYGVQIAYRFNKRLSVQSGIHTVDYAYQTHNISLFQNGVESRYANIRYYDNIPLMQTQSTSTERTALTSEKTSDLDPSVNLTQVYGYIEVPLEAKYRLNPEGNVGINIIGGFSTLVLNKNEIFIESSGINNRLGEASNLNSLNFSGNLGVELEYNVYKNVNFNLIPMFKIQTQTVNNEKLYMPYSVGIYSGLNLRF